MGMCMGLALARILLLPLEARNTNVLPDAYGTIALQQHLPSLLGRPNSTRQIFRPVANSLNSHSLTSSTLFGAIRNVSIRNIQYNKD
jgi:hypothetical protein